MRTDLKAEYTTEQLEAALLVALYTRDSIEAAIDTDDMTVLRYGLCAEWEEQLDHLKLFGLGLVDIRNELYQEWPGYSGERWYPIPMPGDMQDAYDEYESDGGSNCEAEWMYDNTDDMYEGEYGAMRMDCLQYLIERLTEATE